MGSQTWPEGKRWQGRGAREEGKEAQGPAHHLSQAFQGGLHLPLTPKCISVCHAMQRCGVQAGIILRRAYSWCGQSGQTLCTVYTRLIGRVFLWTKIVPPGLWAALRGHQTMAADPPLLPCDIGNTPFLLVI